MKIERLMSIIVTLLAKKSVTASELAERFQVTTRTIYRDIDTLSLAGIPIYSKKGINGGFYLDEDYKLTNLFFSDAEKQFIYEVSHGLTKSVSHPDFEELNQKMSYLVDASKKATPYLFDFTLWKTSQVMLEKIEQGIEENKTITFEYVSYKGETTFREVQPINLVYKS
ncbi:HTH domain-containing protein [Vagococcus sp. DIV0080]|uniref:HTH domain-containing protein n=1 Tax=Candidatus Vagococcus giribetii TaxID=2230876 RepID=A0ABS3HRF4_9ENTE|nr:HTH domain-containing protein [Vagococcus sp. DIV0080]MBO0476299.1 HTH domain-containing protein [Vagococcus sp. DIV0080]